MESGGATQGLEMHRRGMIGGLGYFRRPLRMWRKRTSALTCDDFYGHAERECRRSYQLSFVAGRGAEHPAGGCWQIASARARYAQLMRRVNVSVETTVCDTEMGIVLIRAILSLGAVG